MASVDVGGATIGLIVYLAALIAFTLVILRNREFTLRSAVLLALGWVPFLVFAAAFVLTLATGGGSILQTLLAWLIVAGPILAIIGLILLVMKLMTAWRG